MSQKNVPMGKLGLSSNQCIAVARAVATEAMPYFTAGILDLVPREVPGLGTMGLTGGSILLFDPETLKTWSPSQAGGVTLHEYMHKFLRHEERFLKLVAAGVMQDTSEDRAQWNRYCDAEINDDLIAAGVDLPSFTGQNGEVIPPITPENNGWPPNKLAEEYLQIDRKNKPPKPPGGGQGQQPQPQPGQPPPGQGHGPGCGHCGSASANPLPQEPPRDDPEARSDADQDITRNQVIQDIKQTAKTKGKVPAGLERFVELEGKPAKVPWQQKLSRGLRSSVAFRAGSVDYTFKRPSRRQGAYIGMRDAPLLPGMHAPMAEVALVVDTSGSMGDAEVQKILTEAEGIIKAMPGAKITVIACDSKVHSLIKTRSVKEMKKSLKGGGGTDFRPAFKAIEKLRPKPNVVVFGTDGYGDYPRTPPKDINVIWLNIGGQISAGWGEVIDVQDDE